MEDLKNFINPIWIIVIAVFTILFLIFANSRDFMIICEPYEIEGLVCPLKK